MSEGAAEPTPIERAVRDREERDRLRRRRDTTADHVDWCEKKVAEARRALQDESADVAALESFSWSRIAAGFAGTRDSDLMRERSEEEAARYAVAAAEAPLAAAVEELAAAEHALATLGDVDAAYARALDARQAELEGTSGPTARRLREIAQRRGELLAQDRELVEAHSAGRAAAQLFADADGLLGSARSWSTWDAFGGGGMLTDAMKYDRLDQATRVLQRADVALGRFARELGDVGPGGIGALGTGGLTRTFDVFFDNIVSDLAVRSRITDAAERVTVASSAVARALGRLELQRADVTRELTDLAAEREELLVGDHA